MLVLLAKLSFIIPLDGVATWSDAHTTCVPVSHHLPRAWNHAVYLRHDAERVNTGILILQVTCQRPGQASCGQYPAAVMPQLSMHCPSLRSIALSSAAVSFCSRCSASVPHHHCPRKFMRMHLHHCCPYSLKHGRNWRRAGRLFKAKNHCIVQALRRRSLWIWICPH